MVPETLHSFLVLAFGFAIAGLLSTGFQLVAQRPASFRLLEDGPTMARCLAVALIVFAAPFVIMRSTLIARRVEARRFETVMLATIVAGLWSLMSGTVVMMALDTLGALLPV